MRGTAHLTGAPHAKPEKQRPNPARSSGVHEKQDQGGRRTHYGNRLTRSRRPGRPAVCRLPAARPGESSPQAREPGTEGAGPGLSPKARERSVGAGGGRGGVRPSSVLRPSLRPPVASRAPACSEQGAGRPLPETPRRGPANPAPRAPRAQPGGHTELATTASTCELNPPTRKGRRENGRVSTSGRDVCPGSPSALREPSGQVHVQGPRVGGSPLTPEKQTHIRSLGIRLQSRPSAHGRWCPLSASGGPQCGVLSEQLGRGAARLRGRTLPLLPTRWRCSC